MFSLYPMLMEPALKDIIWGGYNLSVKFGKGSEGQKIAESWELSAHPSGSSTVADGIYKGYTINDLTRALSGDIIAPGWGDKPFPILIKLIDARDNLSVQVHPDDSYAQAQGQPFGKTEMWHVLSAEEGARLVYGFKHNITRELLSSSLSDGTIEQHLNYVSVKAGDTFFIPAGMIHAIGGGITLAEVQQSSDTTYRVYDYNRPGADGKPRELHVRQALDVCTLTTTENVSSSLPLSCEYFSAQMIEAVDPVVLNADVSFHSLLCTEGAGVISFGGTDYPIKMGQSYFIPCGLGEYTVSGGVKILLSSI